MHKGISGTGAKWVHVQDLFCEQHRCPTVVNGLDVYGDDNHITPAYAKFAGDVPLPPAQACRADRSSPRRRPATARGVAASAGPAEPAGERRRERREIETCLRQPAVVEVGVRVPLTAVAQQRDDAAGSPRSRICSAKVQGAPDVRPRRGTDPAAENLLERPRRGDRRGVRDRDHPFHDTGHEAGSTLGRPIPSIRDPRPVVRFGSEPHQPGKNAEFSGSTTARFVASRR